MSRSPAPSQNNEDAASVGAPISSIEQIIASLPRQTNEENTSGLVYTLLRETPSQEQGVPPRYQYIWSDDTAASSETWSDADLLQEYLRKFKCAALSWKPSYILEITLIPENSCLPSSTDTSQHQFVTIKKLHHMIHKSSTTSSLSSDSDMSDTDESSETIYSAGGGSAGSLHDTSLSLDAATSAVSTEYEYDDDYVDYDDDDDSDEYLDDDDEVDMYQSPAATAIAARAGTPYPSYGTADGAARSSSPSAGPSRFRFPQLPNHGIHQFNLFLPPVYALGHLIGQGEFSKVFLAVNIETEGIYAVKIFRQRQCAIVTEQIIREVETLKGLDCPNILKVVETILYGDNTFMIMELMRKGDMRVYINKHGHQSEIQSRRFFMDLLNGVYYLHRRNIVHLDLKLENLLLDDEYNLKITDFGCARLQLGQKTFNHPCGSYAYGAPEVISGGEFDGRKADTWSMGVILYCLLMARLPYCDKEHDVSKMLDERRNPPPMRYPMTITCKDLLARLLTFTKEKRASIQIIMSHHWMHSLQVTGIPQDAVI